MNNEFKEIKDLIIEMREEFHSEIKEIKADIIEMREEFRSEIKELKADIRELKQDVAELKQDVAVLKQDVAVLKQEVAELRQDVADLTKRMDMVEFQVSMNNKKLKELNYTFVILDRKVDRGFTRTDDQVDTIIQVLRLNNFLPS